MRASVPNHLGTTTTLDSNGFTITVTCADIVVTTVPATHTYVIPPAAGSTTTAVEYAPTYGTTTSNVATCPVTYTLMKGALNWAGAFLGMTAAG